MMVSLRVNNEPRTLLVVRSGQGTSRIDRFEGSTHALDDLVPQGKVSGEISIRDLEALTFGSPVEIVRVGQRATVRVPEEVYLAQQQSSRPDRLFPAYVVHSNVGESQMFAVGFQPSRAQGEAGRRFDEEALADFVAGLSVERRRVLALAQIASMPKSGRAGGPVARRRLRFFAGELTPLEFIAALEANPDALLHVTPHLIDDLAGVSAGGREVPLALDGLRVRALDDKPSEGTNVLLASLYAHAVGATAGGTPAFPLDVLALRSSLIERLAAEVHTQSGDLLALKVLATAEHDQEPVREVAIAVLRAAFTHAPGRTLSPSMGLYLSRLCDSGAPEMLEYLLEKHPAQVVCTPDFIEMLPVEMRLDAVRREPRLALERLELDRTAEEVAINELRRRNEPVPSLRSELALQHRRAYATEIREVVGLALRDLSEFETIFADRLRRIRQVVGAPLERERLMAYGGLGTSLREFFWPTLRRIKDLRTRVEMFEFEVRSPFQSPAGNLDAASRRLLDDLSEVPAALESLQATVKDVADRLEALRALARDSALADFPGDAERVFADLPVAMHRFLGVVLNALEGVEGSVKRSGSLR